MHTSVPFHFSTETAMLATLYARSKAQHRSQLFLRHMAQVLRLAKMIVAITGVKSGSGTSGANTPLTPQNDRLGLLIQKLIPALVLAGNATRRMLELHHFVPLQTLLMACYGRLLAVSLHMAADLSIEVDHLLGGTAAPRRARMVVKPTPLTDVGQRIEREMRPREGKSTERKHEDELRSRTASAVSLERKDTPPSRKDTPKEAKVSQISETRKAKRQKDGMDVIFGDENRTKKKKDRSDKSRNESESAVSEISTSDKRKTKGDLTRPAPATSPQPKDAEPPRMDANVPETDGETRKTKRRKDDMDDIFGDDKTKKKDRSDKSTITAASISQGDKSKTKSDKSKLGKGDKIKKRKSKKDAMDDIFGF